MRTFLGQLVLSLQDEASGKAKKAASDITRSLKMIEDQTRRLGAINLGNSVQRQMGQIGASGRQFDQVRRSWERLQKDMQSGNLGTARHRSEITASGTATASHLARVRAEFRSTEKEAQRAARNIRNAQFDPRPAYAADGTTRRQEAADKEKLSSFVRQGKNSLPGLSNEFLMTTAPSFMQDMTAANFGTALSNAHKAFAGNDGGTAIQSYLGLRRGRGQGSLVDSEMFGSDPYTWVKTYLMPALQNAGVNIKDEKEVEREVKQLSGDPQATALLTRMITRSDEIERRIALKDGGTPAADRARTEDPLVPYKGIPGVTGMAVRGMDATGFGPYKDAAAINGLITAGTNLNAAAAALKEAAAEMKKDGWLDEVKDVIEAGRELAESIEGGDGEDGEDRKSRKRSRSRGGGRGRAPRNGGKAGISRNPGNFGNSKFELPSINNFKNWYAATSMAFSGLSKVNALVRGGALASLAFILTGDTPKDPYLKASPAERKRMDNAARKQAEAYENASPEERKRIDDEKAKAYNAAHPEQQLWPPLKRYFFRGTLDDLDTKDHSGIGTPLPAPGPAPAIPAPEPSPQTGIGTLAVPAAGLPPQTMNGIAAQTVGAVSQMTSPLSVTVTPIIDTSSLDAAQAKINSVKASLASLGAAIPEARGNVEAKADADLRTVFTDYGVSP